MIEPLKNGTCTTPWLIAGLLLGVVSRGAATAQPGRDRRGAETFSDSIATLSDGDALKAVERDLMVRAKRDRTNAGLHYRLGVLAVRLRELGDAAAEFKWATQLDPQWAATWFRLGQAELALGEMADTTRLGRRALLSRDAWSRATTAFARAIAVDSLYARQVEQVAFDRGNSPSTVVVRDGLRRAVATPSKNKSALTVLALGRVERLLGDTSAALAAFDLAATMPGGRSVGLLEGAQTRLSKGDGRGAEGYFLAAAIDDSAAIGFLRADIAWIATAEELRRFDSASGSERAQMLVSFWSGRDRADLRNNGERLLEHHRRLAVASRTYSNRDDQRFAVLVRHGEPDNRAAARPAGTAPNESWRYRRAEGDLLVHFVAGADTTNYRIVESVFDVTPDGGIASAAGDEKPTTSTDLLDVMLRSRAQLSPFYQAAAAGRRDQLATFKVRERELGRVGRNLALTTDRFPLRFERDLAARVEILSGADQGNGQIEVAFSIPSFAFDSSRSVGPARFPVRVRIALWDSTAAARAIDTTLNLAAAPGNDGEIVGLVAIPATPGRYAVRAVIEAGDARGVMTTRDVVKVGGDGPLVLSDLVIGVAGRRVTLGSDRPLDLIAKFERSDTIVASAILFGAMPGGFRTRVFVRPIGGAGKEEKWRGFPGVDRWTAVTLDERRLAKVALPLKGLKPGRYEIELVVADDDSLALRERTRFEVVEIAR